MKKIGFIGAYDKIDLILYIAKILTLMDNKVLLVDSSIDQKARYVVPSMDPTISYITSFEDIDVAVGFRREIDIKNYVAEDELPYDYVLVDCDMPERLIDFNLENAFKSYFVTSYDIYSLRKGMEILDAIQNSMNLSKVVFAKDVGIKEDNDYLDFLARDKKVVWDNDIIYFQTENGDSSVIYENQRVGKIKFKRLSVTYRDSMSFMTQQIADLQGDLEIRKAMKKIDKV